MEQSRYLCIDLKSFYASVECVERGLDPMTTRLVVADPERSDKTICLAVSPALRAMGIPGRCRVFEIPRNIKYIMAPPRMRKYIEYAAEIYGIYLDYISPQDIHVYSIDEAFLDVTRYQHSLGRDAREIALMLMGEIRRRLGIRATCGIGTNLYLAKVALDITAKHSPDFIGELNEQSYRDTLWQHMPLTDFWRIGPGISRKLNARGITNMGELAHADEDMLYDMFGVDAELLIDHAWGREPVTIADIQAYVPRTSCLSSGQVLMRDYSFEEGRIIVREMMDKMCLEMVRKGLVCSSASLMIGYSNSLHAEPAKGTAAFGRETSADCAILPAMDALYDRIVAHDKPVRRVYVNCNDVHPAGAQQLSMFDAPLQREIERDNQRQRAILDIQRRYGKNAVLKGISLLDAATARERNLQIGGHKSGE